MFIFGIIVVILGFLMLIGFMINSNLSKNELEKIEPYGEMIEVHGEKMHLYSMGRGNETIVLLPGFGVSLPSADFGPLMRELSKKYRVVALEYFGVGFSDNTATPRTNENYTREIRSALTKAGFTPPYILMPHSASGIQCEYYASKYPDEVKAIIMLDTTSSAVKGMKGAPGFVYSIAKFQQSIGMTRVNAKLMPETKLVKNGYTEKEISDYRTFTYHVLNDTLIDQSNLMIKNIEEAGALPFPESIPVLKLISSDSIKHMAKQKKTNGMNYQEDHLKRLGHNASSKVIEGSHFIYQTKTPEIVQYTEEFLNKINGMEQ